MRAPRLPSWSAALVAALAVAMAATLVYALYAGDFRAESAVLLSMPWGVTSLVDVYVGMALFGGWIAWREDSIAKAGALLLAMALLGNLVACIYALFALRAARGSAQAFWLGARAPDPHTSSTST